MSALTAALHSQTYSRVQCRPATKGGAHNGAQFKFERDSCLRNFKIVSRQEVSTFPSFTSVFAVNFFVLEKGELAHREENS